MRRIHERLVSSGLVGGVAVVSALIVSTTPALATNTDYSTLTSAVDWSSAITALMAVAALVAAVLVVRKGIGFVLGMIGRR